jgi:hypothetical protein
VAVLACLDHDWDPAGPVDDDPWAAADWAGEPAVDRSTR